MCYYNIDVNAFCRIAMLSMKRDLKSSANVNFEVVKYVVDDCLTNI